jgi:hypothetical protein
MQKTQGKTRILSCFVHGCSHLQLASERCLCLCSTFRVCEAWSGIALRLHADPRVQECFFPVVCLARFVWVAERMLRPRGIGVSGSGPASCCFLARASRSCPSPRVLPLASTRFYFSVPPLPPHHPPHPYLPHSPPCRVALLPHLAENMRHNIAPTPSTSSPARPCTSFRNRRAYRMQLQRTPALPPPLSPPLPFPATLPQDVRLQSRAELVPHLPVVVVCRYCVCRPLPRNIRQPVAPHTGVRVCMCVFFVCWFVLCVCLCLRSCFCV